VHEEKSAKSAVQIRVATRREVHRDRHPAGRETRSAERPQKKSFHSCIEGHRTRGAQQGAKGTERGRERGGARGGKTNSLGTFVQREDLVRKIFAMR